MSKETDFIKQIEERFQRYVVPKIVENEEWRRRSNPWNNMINREFFPPKKDKAQ